MKKKSLSQINNELLQENEVLRSRLAETEETLNAIRNGEVDAIVVSGASGDKVFSLTSAETPYRIIIEEMEEGAVTLSETGTILYCNKRFSEMVAVPMEKIIGTNFNKFIGRQERDNYKTLLHEGLKGRIKGETIYFPFEENPKHFHLSFCALPQGMLGKVCIIITDISELKKYEHELQQMVDERTTELKKTNSQLKETNSTKDKLFSIIAHDLKGPFTSMLGFTELLIDYYDNYPPDQFKKILDQINSAARNAHALLENLLMWARSRNKQLHFDPQNIRVQSVLMEVVESLKSVALLKNIALNIANNDDVVGFADENMLKTIIRNLLSNAIKYTRENGSIWISASKHKHEMEISVADNGIGMSEETMNKLFDDCISMAGTANEKGTGLGLMMSKEFIEKHNGILKVESSLGQGSKFSVILPDQKTTMVEKNELIEVNG